jgi:hypothetical protein
MNRRKGTILAVLSALGMAAVIATPAGAQTSDVKEKPPMYSYISNWDIPRAQWADMARRTRRIAQLSKKTSPAVATNAEGLDKVGAAVEEALKANPLGGAAFSSMTDQSGHRDELVRTNATYK